MKYLALLLTVLPLCFPTVGAQQSPAVIEVTNVIPAEVCMAGMTATLENENLNNVNCGEGFRITAESKIFHIEAVVLASLLHLRMKDGTVHDSALVSPGKHYASIDHGFLIIWSESNPEKAKLSSSYVIEVLKAVKRQ